ncbi:cell division cycle 20.6, cofactor of APC complex-like [Pistacia vera]|uniref:cell division cycle 20.6, cofactor of APC complex-like n=1 Tax=Pistacia vera TaxID=55513 RepID=UPI001263B450|nr:cell division cycle 20.6, cofactor of APC complex-like [Pistacia vera]
MSHEILRVDSLDWKNAKILTCGTSEGSIVDIDVRVKSSILLGRHEVHRGGVCKLKWCDNEKQLASGGIDKVVHIWDCSKSSSWLHKFDEHKAAVRAICWCPSEHNVLASGGGVDDHCIKFWDTQKGERLDSVDTGSEVCELIWSKHEREVLSSHGSKSNHMTLWKYPFMLKLTELRAHSSRVLYMSQSPDGYSVASAAPHDSVSIWKNLFGTPGSHKVPPRKRKPGTFSDFPLIRSSFHWFLCIYVICCCLREIDAGIRV